MSSHIPLLNHYDIVIYHKECSDGIGASWVYWSILKGEKGDNFIGTEKGQTEFVGVKAGEFPDLYYIGRNVLVVDICFTKEQITSLSKIVSSLTILDHHKSAMKGLENLDLSIFHTESTENTLVINSDNVHILFDMKRCGTELAWDHFHRDICSESDPSFFGKLRKFLSFILKDTEDLPVMVNNRPWFLQVIADRDLWKWEDSKSKALGTYMFQMGINTWETLEEMLDCEDDEIAKMYDQGLILLDIESRKAEQVVARAVLTKFTTPSDKTYNVYLVGCDHMLASEVGNRLSQKDECDFAVMWRYDYEENKFWLSARADKATTDLSVVSKELGGGGHAKAAGFSLENSDQGLKKYFKKVE